MSPALAALSLAVALTVAPALPASDGPVRTEVRDPLRGVTFVSAQLSDDPVEALEVMTGAFSSADRLAIGLSAMRFDGATQPDEFILWLRHEGRRWLSLDQAAPVAVDVDGEPLELVTPLPGRSFVGPDSRLFEKLEYALSAADVRRLAGASAVTFTLRADTGAVRKRLGPAEVARLAELLAPPVAP